ncbi:hypothetical protein FQN52_002715 [Onygenales sp. PD_12]|nr:hypothetical protein FQN52_002715 [Onygenales sp. PD_12]
MPPPPPKKYTLSVTAGPTYSPTTHTPVPVNTPLATRITTPQSTTTLHIRIQDYSGLPPSSPRTSPYFSHPQHTKDQYSIAISFVPRVDIPGDELVFGNDFDHPIRDNLPPGAEAALRFVKYWIDPGLEGEVGVDRPWLYGRALGSWGVLRVGGVVGDDGLRDGDGDGDGDAGEEEVVIEEGGEDGGEEVRRQLGIPEDAPGRRKFFLDQGNRERFVFEKGRRYLADFSNGYLGFSDFTLRLPGFHIPVAKYINEKNHSLRYVLKNRRTGDVYFVVVFTLLLNEGGQDEESNEDEGEGEGGDDDFDYGYDDDGVD